MGPGVVVVREWYIKRSRVICSIVPSFNVGRVECFLKVNLYRRIGIPQGNSNLRKPLFQRDRTEQAAIRMLSGMTYDD